MQNAKKRSKKEKEDPIQLILTKMNDIEDRLRGLEAKRIDPLEEATIGSVELIGEQETDQENRDPNSDLDKAESVQSLLEEEIEGQDIECLDEDILDVLGEDPTKESAIDTKFHPALQTRWRNWIQSGVNKQLREELLKKYKRADFLVTPKMNPEIISSMNEVAVKRDKHFVESQDLIGTALSSLGGGISMLMEAEEELDKISLLQKLCDAGKLLTLVHHKQLLARKAYIVPPLEKRIKDVLQGTKPDEWVFGANLSENLKESRSLTKSSKELRPQLADKKSTPNSSKFALNWRGPPSGRQPVGQAGYRQPLTSLHRVNFKQRYPQNKGQNQFKGQSQFKGQRTFLKKN